MGLIPSRPRIQLRAAPVVVPGQPIDALVLLEAEAEVQVGSVDVVLEGWEASRLRHSWRHEIVHLGQRLSGPATLRAGRTELPLSLTIGATLPPTFHGRLGQVCYEVLVRVHIPWWLDRRARFRLTVVSPEAASPSVVPGRFTTIRGGPRGTEPYMEGSLATTAIVPGMLLSGVVALGNVEYNRYQALEVALVARETLRQSGQAIEVRRYSAQVPVEQPREGAPIPFRFAVPTDAPPSFRSVVVELGWFMEIRAVLRWHSDLVFWVPVRVLSAARAPSVEAAPRINIPPMVGSPRLQQIWEGVAAESGLVATDEGLEGKVGRVQVQIRRLHRGRRGIFLVGELRYPSLGMGFFLGPVPRRRRSDPGQLSFGDPAWDRRHEIRGRDPLQVSTLGEGLHMSLLAFTAVQMDDAYARVERRGTGHDPRVLRQFAANVVALAAALEQTRAGLPPPAVFGESIPAWERLAARLQGELVRTSMEVSGKLDGLSVEISTSWSDRGTPEDTLVSLLPSPALPSRYAVTLMREGGEIAVPEALELSSEAREILDAVLDRTLALVIEPERADLWLPAPLLDPDLALERLRALVRLCRALGRPGGPYR